MSLVHIDAVHLIVYAVKGQAVRGYDILFFYLSFIGKVNGIGTDLVGILTNGYFSFYVVKNISVRLGYDPGTGGNVHGGEMLLVLYEPHVHYVSLIQLGEGYRASVFVIKTGGPVILESIVLFHIRIVESQSLFLLILFHQNGSVGGIIASGAVYNGAAMMLLVAYHRGLLGQ